MATDRPLSLRPKRFPTHTQYRRRKGGFNLAEYV